MKARQHHKQADDQDSATKAQTTQSAQGHQRWYKATTDMGTRPETTTMETSRDACNQNHSDPTHVG